MLGEGGFAERRTEYEGLNGSLPDKEEMERSNNRIES